MVRGKSKGNTRAELGSTDGFWDRPMLINLLADVLLLAGGVLLAWAGAGEVPANTTLAGGVLVLGALAANHLAGRR